MLNRIYKVNAEIIAEMLGLDMANEEVELFDWDLDDETQAAHYLKMNEKGRKLAALTPICEHWSYKVSFCVVSGPSMNTDQSHKTNDDNIFKKRIRRN